MRGWVGMLVCGFGLRCRPRDPETGHKGEALNFWRVVKFERDRHLALRAEMRLPGEALLEFLIAARGEVRCVLHKTAHFHPRGLFGFRSWHAMVQLHHIVFRGILLGLQREKLQVAADRPEIEAVGGRLN